MPTQQTAPRGIALYRALPRRAGWSYLFATGFGRLPLSMVPLAILTLTTSATGSIAVGGFAAAAAALGEAVGAPASGTLADRFGQRPVLLAGVLVHVALLAALTAGAGIVPEPTTVALAGFAGLSLPQVGALSRARWLAIAPDDLPAAFAFEGVIDEIAYIFGPALVGIVAAFVSPQAGMLLTALLVAVFATQFAVHRTQRLVPRRASSRIAGASGTIRDRRGGHLALIGTLFLGLMCMGVFFGAAQTGLTAFARTVGIPDAGALLYAVMAVGSTLTTVSMVLVPDRVGPWTRWALAAGGMTLGAVLLMSAPTIPWVVVAAFLAGAFQGPLLLTIYGVLGTVAEAGRAGYLMTLAASSVVIGIGAGSAVAGALAQENGPVGGFAVVVTACAVLLVAGLAGAARSVLRRSRRTA
ncbi:MFS transporter [Microbacterium caowuchunii]|uniref:MFS transporter n=1 Tax=Microbacterium caowuchunii TaxID=2614638 RepID=A0A5N0T9G2_9MICO|nr:MFS transporter [Microbacterium caowuchunii]KAA9129929.1 MFS transporter [Microbacterium caowuchunii]